MPPRTPRVTLRTRKSFLLLFCKKEGFSCVGDV